MVEASIASTVCNYQDTMMLIRTEHDARNPLCKMNGVEAVYTHMQVYRPYSQTVGILPPGLSSALPLSCSLVTPETYPMCDRDV
jgi:hypothetical protein